MLCVCDVLGASCLCCSVVCWFKCQCLFAWLCDGDVVVACCFVSLMFCSLGLPFFQPCCYLTTNHSQHAYYFAFLEFYTRWLFYLSIVGFVAFMVMVGDSFNLDHKIAIYYSGFVIIWCTLFVEFWKRQEAVLSLR